MPLTPGTRLGPYTIESLIGSGGMGEVYKAHDERLNRMVAIKRLIADDALVSVTQLDTGRDIIVFSTATGRTRPFVIGRGAQVQPRFSPDERWVAYTSNETGRWEVFVESFLVPGSRHQASVGGGSQPIWRRDGTELFYVAPDGKLMAMSVTPGERWVPANARALFATRMRPLYPPYPYTYDVSPDGQRFLIREVRPDSGPVISILTNWRPQR